MDKLQEDVDWFKDRYGQFEERRSGKVVWELKFDMGGPSGDKVRRWRYHDKGYLTDLEEVEVLPAELALVQLPYPESIRDGKMGTYVGTPELVAEVKLKLREWWEAFKFIRDSVDSKEMM